MEFWQDEKKIALTTKTNGAVACDTWEESNLAGLRLKYSASFMEEVDARVYLSAKYPDAVERSGNADETVAASLSVLRPTPPHDLRDDDAWRKYREDSRRYRAAASEDAA